jgi:transketolase
MGGIANGIAYHGGFIPYDATFLTFSDYMRGAVRLSALAGLHVIDVWTHVWVGLGEDGPTHQPVEQLAVLRAIPQLIVIRPSDANETAVAWQVAIENRARPVTLVLTRQNVPTLDRSRFAPADGLRKGAYILADAQDGKPDIILIGTGSEVALVVAAREKLAEQKIQARVVAMPSWELFDQQPQAYRDQVLPPSVRARLAVEAALSQGWHRYVGDGGAVIGVDRFGASAPGNVVMEKYGFTVGHVIERAAALVKK